MPAYTVSAAGGRKIDLVLKEALLAENPDKKTTPITAKVLDEISFKFASLPLKNQWEEYTKDEANITSMKGKLYDHYIANKNLKISYFTRLSVPNTALFGNVDDEEPNIAYSFLKSLIKVDTNSRKKVCSNIVLSGGCASYKNFHRRFRQEVMALIQTRQEFARLKNIESAMVVKPLIYSPNIHSWLGGGVASNLLGIEKYAITSQIFKENSGEVPRLISDLLFEYNRNESKRLQEETEKSLMTIFNS